MCDLLNGSVACSEDSLRTAAHLGLLSEIIGVRERGTLLQLLGVFHRSCCALYMYMYICRLHVSAMLQ